MMMRTAGGPGLVSPIDFGERKKPLKPATWIAIGVVAAAHVGVGAALYYQRFEALIETPPEDPGPPIDVVMRPLPKPDPVVSERPPAPNPPIHSTPVPSQPVDPLIAVIPDHPATNTGPLVTLSRPTPPTTAVDVTPEPVLPRPPAVITSPRWASQPSAAQMARAYPDRALDNGVGPARNRLPRLAAVKKSSVAGCPVSRHQSANAPVERSATVAATASPSARAAASSRPASRATATRESRDWEREVMWAAPG